MTQDLLNKWARETPNKIFAVFETGTQWSYAEALRLSWRVSNALSRLGVKPGQSVLSLLPNGEEAIAVFFGANAAGAIYAPINVAYRGGILQHALNLPRSEILIVSDDLYERLRGLDLPYIKTIVVVGIGPLRKLDVKHVAWADLEESEIVEPPKICRRKATDDMVYIYTSGTTGPSKAVRCSYRHHEIYADWYGRDLNETDRCFLCLPMFHVGGTGWLYTMLVRGGSIAVVERFRTEDFWPAVKRMGATTCTFMAAMARFLFRQPAKPDDADNPIRVACLVPYIPETEEFSKRFNVELFTGYAMSEVPGPLRTDAGTSNMNRAGKAASSDWQLRLVDADGYDVPTGSIGELVVRHTEPSVITRGYLNMPEATAEAWTDGWFHTGDLFKIDAEGNYHFVDRNKDALRRRGENISSIEVEAEINQHPSVSESAIIGVPSNEMEDDVFAYVVKQPGAGVSHEELFDFLVDRMPHFMVPRYIEFIDELPRTPNHKVAKGDLRKRERAAAWDREEAGIKLTAKGVVRTVI
ncbi:crotonobetaine/carnitine-CoA ligase [Advenella incenata]|uniref:Crotonobetaine/carnitine-CoA ligase n=1 Tax=Advenella incenata TaxID=267800 RepID=A0A4Q7VFV1_9BURK|nr:AMP-binding protein [Advenella incenata]RZT94872.1 crotonobetaine/carnitine-CoA ligase [Advenella incenata]